MSGAETAVVAAVACFGGSTVLLAGGANARKKAKQLLSPLELPLNAAQACSDAPQELSPGEPLSGELQYQDAGGPLEKARVEFGDGVLLICHEDELKEPFLAIGGHQVCKENETTIAVKQAPTRERNVILKFGTSQDTELWLTQLKKSAKVPVAEMLAQALTEREMWRQKAEMLAQALTERERWLLQLTEQRAQQALEHAGDHSHAHNGHAEHNQAHGENGGHNGHGHAGHEHVAERSRHDSEDPSTITKEWEATKEISELKVIIAELRLQAETSMTTERQCDNGNEMAFNERTDSLERELEQARIEIARLRFLEEESKRMKVAAGVTIHKEAEELVRLQDEVEAFKKGVMDGAAWLRTVRLGFERYVNARVSQQYSRAEARAEATKIIQSALISSETAAEKYGHAGTGELFKEG